MGLIRLLLIIFIFAILTDAILSYFPKSQEQKWARKLRIFCDFFLNPLRSLFPADMPFDVTPMIVILGTLVLMQLQFLLHWGIQIFVVIIFIDVIISYISQLREKNFVKRFHQLMSFSYAPVRRFLPESLNFDIAPFLLVIFLVAIDKLW